MRRSLRIVVNTTVLDINEQRQLIAAIEAACEISHEEAHPEIEVEVVSTEDTNGDIRDATREDLDEPEEEL